MSRVIRSGLHRALVDALRRTRRPDGGFPTALDGRSEVEPTVVAALALQDDRALAWLEKRQATSGADFDEDDGRVNGPTTAALAALALVAPLRRAAISRVRDPPSWPSAAERPGSRSAVRLGVDDRHAVTRRADRPCAPRRECAYTRERCCARGGGCVHARTTVRRRRLELRQRVGLRRRPQSYPQTTAVALISLQGVSADLTRPALRYLRRGWRLEPGGLTLAQTLVAFRLHGEQASVAGPLAALEGLATQQAFRRRPLAVAWAVLATGPTCFSSR